MLNVEEFLVLQARVFEKLDIEWKTFKWDEKELKWICSSITSKDPMVDTSNFHLNLIAYIEHARTY